MAQKQTVTSDNGNNFLAFLESGEKDNDVEVSVDPFEVTDEDSEVAAGQDAEDSSSQHVEEPAGEQQKADDPEEDVDEEEDHDPISRLSKEMGQLREQLAEERRSSKNARAGMAKAFEAHKAVQRQLEELSKRDAKPPEDQRTDKFVEFFDTRMKQAQDKFPGDKDEQEKWSNFHASLDLVKEEMKSDLRDMVEENPWVKAIQTEADAEIQKNLLSFQNYMKPIFAENKELHLVWQQHLIQRMKELGYFKDGNPDFVRFEKTPESIQIAYQAAKYAQGVTGKTNLKIPNSPDEFEKVLAYHQGRVDASKDRKLRGIHTTVPKGTGLPKGKGKGDDDLIDRIVNARRF